MNRKSMAMKRMTADAEKTASRVTYEATSGAANGGRCGADKMMTTRELAEKLGTKPNVITENAKKCIPNKKIENGKTTYWNEQEATVILECIKNNKVGAGMNLSNHLIGVSTVLTPSLRMMEAMRMFEAAAHDEIERLKSEKESLRIELDQSKEWYSIKRIEKLNPGKHFNYRLLKNESRRLGLEVKKVFDQNYGEVNAYHRDVWESLYFDSVDFD